MDETIRIYDCENMCTVCNKPYKWRKHYTNVERLERGYVKEVEFITTHTGCLKLLCKYQKLQDDLLDTEWKLFQLQYNNFRRN